MIRIKQKPNYAMRVILLLLAIFISNLSANNPVISGDGNLYQSSDVAQSESNSSVKFLKYYKLMPDEVSLTIFKDMDLSSLGSKKLLIGYGMGNPSGKNCKIFKKEDTGNPTDVTICVPWFRIEREYMVPPTDASSNFVPFIDEMAAQRIPMLVNYCNKYSDNKVYPGGLIACTTYFSTINSAACRDNPKLDECRVDNCAQGIRDKCEYLTSVIGDVETLDGAIKDASDGSPVQDHTKVELTSHQFMCPSGPISEKVKCQEQETTLVYPEECIADDISTIKDDPVLTYCNEADPVRDLDNKIIGFNGTCADGRSVVCRTEQADTTTRRCSDPIYESAEELTVSTVEQLRNYVERTVFVSSDLLDPHADEENCLRVNDINDARGYTQLSTHIIGNGYLDDDIYIFKHFNNSGHYKIYCNMQHSGNNALMSYNGSMIQCLKNSGNYSFDKVVPIEHNDIVSVQQASELDKSTSTPLFERNHYGSTQVTINGIKVAPETKAHLFPYYPAQSPWLKTWDNGLGTLSLLFPFTGAYEIYFYNKDGEEVISRAINDEDFITASSLGSKQLMLGKDMKLNPDMEDDDANSGLLKANRKDDWVEWGGGVYGGRNSTSGAACSSPNDNYVKANAIYNIVIKDLLTSAITTIPLTYPLAYPNRVFISKLKVDEKRIYRCYEDFPEYSPSGAVGAKRVCSESNTYKDYIEGNIDNIDSLTKWNDNELCEQDCRTYSACESSEENNITVFECSQNNGVNIGGDINGNTFSSESSCESACFLQNQCTDYIIPNKGCTTKQEELTNPITDMRGHTVFEKRNITYSCKNYKDVLVGCNKYEINTMSGNLSYFASTVGTEGKDFSDSMEKAITKVSMLEVGHQHIWSGWRGECRDGLKWDFSYLSDPMTIVSYAMQAYATYTWNPGATTTSDPDTSAGADASAGAGAGASTGSAIGTEVAKAVPEATKSWATSMSESFSEWSSDLTNSFNDAYEAVKGVFKPVTDSINTVNDTITDGYAEIVNGAEQGYAEIGKAVSDLAPTGVVDMGQTALDNLDTWSSAATEKMTALYDGSVGKVVEGVSGYANDAAAMVKEATNIDWGGVVVDLGFETITQGELISAGVELIMLKNAPAPEDYILAKRLLIGETGHLGGEDTQNYNNCMSSIGLGLPNLIAWGMSEDESTSKELRRPWENPIRLTPKQLGTIAAMTSEEYVISHYMMSGDMDDMLINVIAISPDAYMKAGEIICAGPETYMAMAHIRAMEAAKNAEDDSGGGGGGFKITGMMVAKMVIGMVCPPCGLALSIITGLMDNVFAGVDTCGNEMDAMQWSDNDYKTHKFLENDQCHAIESFCDKEVSWKGCVRTAYSYCCYDQITTKIFAEGLKAQLNKGWESCNDITINDLQNISFRECTSDEDPYLNKCFPTDKYSEFQQTLFRRVNKNMGVGATEGLTEQIMNSMVLE